MDMRALRTGLTALAIVATPVLADDIPLAFSNALTPEHATAKALLEAEGGFPIEDEYISIAEVDLDMDGTNELFVFADASYFCGSAGCIPRIYRREEEGWSEIPISSDDFINSYPEMWTLAPAPENGHRVLVMTGDGHRTEVVWNEAGYSTR